MGGISGSALLTKLVISVAVGWILGFATTSSIPMYRLSNKHHSIIPEELPQKPLSTRHGAKGISFSRRNLLVPEASQVLGGAPVQEVGRRERRRMARDETVIPVVRRPVQARAGHKAQTTKKKRRIFLPHAGIALPPSSLVEEDVFDYPKPIVFFDIEIGGQPVGQIIFELFTRQAPRAAENFRALFTGERGIVPDEEDRLGAGLPLHFKGSEFYRVIKDFICQTGTSTESIYGGFFEDDPAALLLKHDRKGLMSVVGQGPNSGSSHFAILTGPSPHLDGQYCIFGQVVSGMEIVDQINALAPEEGSEDDSPIRSVVIVDSGQLDCNENGICRKMDIKQTDQTQQPLK